MEKVAALVIVLVGLLEIKAHDVNSSKFTKGWLSITQTTTSRSENSSKENVAGSKSIVVNWSLVCEDLCGGGFGGPICGKNCYNSQIRLFSIDNSKYESVNLCPVLCEYKLGGKNCECTIIPNDQASRDALEFCNDFCKFTNVTINGCPRCLPIQHLDIMNLPSTLDSDTSSIPPNIPKPMTTISKPTDPKAKSAFTTISSTISTTTTTPLDDTISTTPDWYKVCNELCKKGEGGQLCNCDLTPLTLSSD